MPSLLFDIGANLVSLQKDMEQANKTITSFTNTTKQAFTDLKQVIGALGIGVGLNEITEQFFAAERASMKMGLALRNTGDYSHAAMKEMEDYAAAIQKTTAFEDDQVLAIMATMKSYGMTIDQVKKATTAILDLTAAGFKEGVTIQTASEAIGAAYLGQAKGLKGLGIVIDDTKDKTEIFNKALSQIEERTGGAAQAQLATYEGRWKQMKNTMGDVAEFMGHAFLKALEVVSLGFEGTLYAGSALLEGIIGGLQKFVSTVANFARMVGFDTIADKLDSASRGLFNFNQEVDLYKEQMGDTMRKNIEAIKTWDGVKASIDSLGRVDKPWSPPELRNAEAMAEWNKRIASSIRDQTSESERFKKAFDALGDKMMTVWNTINNEGADPLKEKMGQIDAEVKKLRDDLALLPDELKEAYNISVDLYESTKKQQATEEAFAAARKEWQETDKQAIEDETKGIAAMNKVLKDDLDLTRKRIDAEINLMEMRTSDAIHKKVLWGIITEGEAINEQINMYKALIEKEQERGRISGEDHIKSLQNIQDYTKAIDDLSFKSLRASEDIQNGFIAAFIEIGKEAVTWGEAGYQVVKSFVTDSQTVAGDMLFDFFTGELDDLSDYWDSIWKSILRTFSDILGQMAVKWAASGIANLFGLSTAPGSIIGSILGTGVQAVGAGGAAAAGAAAGGSAFAFGGAAAPFMVVPELAAGGAAAAGAGAAGAGAAAVTGAETAAMAASSAIPVIGAAAAAAFLANAFFENFVWSAADPMWNLNYMPEERLRMLIRDADPDDSELYSMRYIYEQRFGPYKAARGLAYVPWDNFLISAHEGESVLPKEEAEQWRDEKSSGSGRYQHITINMQIDRQTIASTILDMTQDGIKVIDERGIVRA